MDKKLTDSEIVKALECCSTASCISNKCHYEKLHDIPTCTTKLTKDALDLINRLQAEIERLNALIAETNKQRGKVIHAITRIDEVKTEAYKEFAEKLKEKAYLNDGVNGFRDLIVEVDDINNILEELTERKED